MNKMEYFKTKELIVKIELYLALTKFCDEVSQHDPCLNFRKCDKCNIQEKIEKLKEEIFMQT